MKIGVIAENLLERIFLALGYVPTPYIETQLNIVLARSIMVANKLGVFEALVSEGLTVEDISTRCGTIPGALQKLLSTLVSAGYIFKDKERYVLAPVARKWLLKEGEHSLHDMLIFNQTLDWEWLTKLEDFVRTGKSVQMHNHMSPEQWEIYQRGMRSLANISALEVGRRTPIPKKARKMLDIGGSHGYYSVSICKRHPDLQATILDLPQAIEYAKPILAKEKMGERVVLQAGNALKDNLGTEIYDVVFISNLVHHFDETNNCELFGRVAKSLRPGGYLVIQEPLIVPNEVKQFGRLLDLYFALVGGTENWSFKEIAKWQQQAGLIPMKLIRFWTAPGAGQQVAMKP